MPASPCLQSSILAIPTSSSDHDQLERVHMYGMVWICTCIFNTRGCVYERSLVTLPQCQGSRQQASLGLALTGRFFWRGMFKFSKAAKVRHRHFMSGWPAVALSEAN